MTKHAPQAIAMALDMRERGIRMGTIARRTGIPPSTIEYHCLKNGADSPRFGGKPARRMAPLMRNGVLVRPFSNNEDDFIRAARLADTTYTAIAEALGRQISSIRMRLLILARIDARAELEKGAAE